ncbi:MULTISPECIES: helix-turn-helix domain-containing protein [unclassified Variovorax]|jgi:AraC-like DNA-binding protein|uniref:AraC-like ligand-binding domain-containing protein n=1 Tax=unclassified Variovorax TaxID=663243 RepID=UPI000F7F0AA0|nr:MULTISPECIES: helix-turn-helix domain-containing protein [unclassified Variovorax]RSZ34460.1 helix-turn-helix domain-containing protein [Variovorax sp. 553]RSZ34956.1 helix-turn-helix domain-containing protein [Variovorax sp. 679]
MSNAAIHRWSTDAVPAAQRLDYWVGAVCEGFLEMDVTSPVAASFGATLESAPLGPIVVNQVRGSAQDVYRTRRAIAHSRNNYFYLLCKTDSAWVAVQDGRSARLLPGDAVLVDSRRLYEFHLLQSADTISLELPTAWVDSWIPDAGDQVARRIDGHAGWGGVLCGFVRQLSPEMAAKPPMPAELLGDQLGGLLALATGRGHPDAATRGARAALRRRVLDATRERHAEPGLTAASVARVLGISERSLHRCLAGCEGEGATTFAGALAGFRMAAARRMLGDARFDRLGIAEIGYRVGLTDASHFVRQCRAHLGATPGELRRRR